MKDAQRHKEEEARKSLAFQQHNRRDCFVQTDPNVQILKQPVMSMKDLRLIMRAKNLSVSDKKASYSHSQANLLNTPGMTITAKAVVQQFQNLVNQGALGVFTS